MPLLLAQSLKGDSVDLHTAVQEEGDRLLVSDLTLDRKVEVLLKLRKYKLVKREEGKEGEFLTIKSPKGENLLVWAVTGVETIGVQYINQLAKEFKARELEGGIMISNGKYTYSARTNAGKKEVELIPPNFPSFNIFEHHLVPEHEILSPEEKEKVLEQFRVKPYQLPLIRESDPIVKVIGAKPGDLIRIVRKSPTAGEYVSYRYVAEG